jgi:hypothetical protein
MTKQILEDGNLLEIKLLDHINSTEGEKCFFQPIPFPLKKNLLAIESQGGY